MKRFTVSFLLILSVTLFVLFLFSPDVVQKTAHEGVLFCASVLIPSLFPGFVLTDLIISLSSRKRKNGTVFQCIFRLPSACFRCWLIGLLAGFPAAADCTAQSVLSGEISKKDGERCLAFTNNPGIVFVICAVGGGLFGSFSVGVYLWVIQTLSAFLVGIVFADPKCLDSEERFTERKPISLIRIFPKAVVSSVVSVLNICGFVIFFRVLISVLTFALPLNGVQIMLAGLLEITCGISHLNEFSFFSAVLASLMLGWSGFSVHFQILNVISAANMSAKYYFPGKGLQGIFSCGIAALSYPLLYGDFSLQNLCVCVAFAVILFASIFLIRFRKEYLYGKQKL